MAIPFNLPEDHNEVEIIINQLQYLLTKLQSAVRRSRGAGTSTSQVIVPRVRTMANRSRATEALTPAPVAPLPPTPPSPTIPDLLSNLATLAASEEESSRSSSSAPSSSRVVQVSNYLARSPRRRNSSDSFSCEETKISITTVLNREVQQDWNRNDENGIQPKTTSLDSILTKLTGPASAPLWTAMICFVGWHLFKAR